MGKIAGGRAIGVQRVALRRLKGQFAAAQITDVDRENHANAPRFVTQVYKPHLAKVITYQTIDKDDKMVSIHPKDAH